MPIIGLTDKQAALPIIGVLRKGEEKTQANKPGEDLDYFRFTSDDQDALTVFNAAYPTKKALQHINVFLPHMTTDENMDSWMEHWVAGGLKHRCDGKTVVLWQTDKGDYSTDHKKCPGGCKEVGRLSVIIPELGRFATVTVLTTSIWDITNLTSQLRSYEALKGDLRGIPFVVSRRPKKISTPSGKNGKRARREKWLLSIETQPEWTRLQLAAIEHAALPEKVDIIEPHQYVIEATASVVEPEVVPEQAQESDQPQNPNDNDTPKVGKAKPFKFTSGLQEKFYNTVQEHTNNGYTSPFHLFKFLGGGFNWEDGDLWEAKLSIAVDHHREKINADLQS